MRSTLALAAPLLLWSAQSAHAQVAYEVIPAPGFNQAIGISDSGEYVCGTGGSNGFLWSKSGGLVTGFGLPVEAWAVTDDGQTMGGVFLNGSTQQAGVWTAGGGAQLEGNLGGPGCGNDLSHIFDLSSDGTTGVGMAWQGCQVTPIRWTQGSGLTALSKQSPSDSARASRCSGDGLVSVGWDQGGGSGRRACVWTDDSTQIFPATTPTNPQGLGEVTAVNSDGSVYAGSTLNRAFRSTPGGGFELLPNVAGLGGQYFANGISEDGSVAVGVRLQFPVADGVVWLPGMEPVLMVDFLASNGINVPATDVRNCTGVSADGSVICGWGNAGPWIVTLGDSRVSTYCTAKASSVGCFASISTNSPANAPVSGAGGYSVTASSVHSFKNGLLFASLTGAAAIPFNGGTLCMNPPLKRGPITGSGGMGVNNCSGAYSTEVNAGDVIPAGLDAGSGNSGWYQYWYRDPQNGAGQLGTALSDAVQLDFQ